jgi:hypothetical protein
VDRTDVEVVFRTGLLQEADIVANALEDAGVPFYRQSENVAGIAFAMPVHPAPGPGAWLVVVPSTRAAAARKIVRRLPVSNDPSPGFFGFHPRPEVKRFYRQYGWFLVVGLALVIVWDLIQLFRQ